MSFGCIVVTPVDPKQISVVCLWSQLFCLWVESWDHRTISTHHPRITHSGLSVTEGSWFGEKSISLNSRFPCVYTSGQLLRSSTISGVFLNLCDRHLVTNGCINNCFQDEFVFYKDMVQNKFSLVLVPVMKASCRVIWASCGCVIDYGSSHTLEESPLCIQSWPWAIALKMQHFIKRCPQVQWTQKLKVGAFPKLAPTDA